MTPDKKELKFDNAKLLLRNMTGAALKISIIIIFVVVSWRIAWSDVSFDLSKFDFSDLLALILALFAIAMSVAFYFKSTDSSNQFYDNIYNFTQKTSEILGRIEERFGERLKHLDEGYGRIQSRFDGLAKTPDEIQEKVKETEGKEEKEKKRLEEANKEMQQLMENLTKRAKMEQREKEQFYQKMGELAAEKDMAQDHIRAIEAERDKMQEQLAMMKRDMMRGIGDMRSPVIDEILHHPEIRSVIRRHLPIRQMQERIGRVLSSMPSEYLEQLYEEGILNERRELTKAGLILLQTASRRYL